VKAGVPAVNPRRHRARDPGYNRRPALMARYAVDQPDVQCI